ncbi:DrmB family protein [Candidatus Sumerlaeota bacterium]
MALVNPKKKVGELRPSQILFTFGVGAVVDLPDLSVMVMGLDDWQVRPDSEISEPRLLQAVCQSLNGNVQRLMSPPVAPDTNSPFDEDALVGVPIAAFPRWLVCPFCRTLAPVDSGLFELKHHPYRPERTRYIHVNCKKQGAPPTVMPVRFLVACENGHLDDFPWVEFVHQGPTDCNSILQLREFGTSGEAADVDVFCTSCKKRNRMSLAFGPKGKDYLQKCSGTCSGRRPHLRDTEPDGCGLEKTSILLGASNSWFSVMLSVISIPSSTSKVDQVVEEHWARLQAVESEQNVGLIKPFMPELGKFPDTEIWEAICKRKENVGPSEEPADLKRPEWAMFSNPDPDHNTGDFRLTRVESPPEYRQFFDKVVKVERLREVRALTGFTRIDAPGDNTEINLNQVNVAPLSRSKPSWVPAIEIRGEGIFIQFDESRLRKWTSQMTARGGQFAEAHRRWRAARGAEDPKAGFPGIRFVLLHSFAHALMRQLSLECGYTAASIRERIYSASELEDEGAMAGVLIYTAAPDSEGTLGGLVSLADTDAFERHLNRALYQMRLCASDPLCAEHDPCQDELSVHGAACHACLFAPETSCERGNRYLDRSVLVETYEEKNYAFFTGIGE